jgi:hypothetical protein
MLLATSSCGGDNPFGNQPGVYLVRVLNSFPDAITVTIGPANYGSIAPNQTTAYMQVANGDNQVLLNGQVFQASPAEFADGFPGTLRWTYEFGEDSWGFSSDDL